MICHKCKFDNLNGTTFCENCGASLIDLPDSEMEKEGELEQKITEVKNHLREALKLQPEEVKEHLNHLRKNLRLGKGNLKARLLRLKDDLMKGDLEGIFSNSRNSIKNMLISFIAWAILKFSTPYHRRIIVFLISPFGLIVLLILAYIYGTYEKEIQEKVESMKRSE